MTSSSSLTPARIGLTIGPLQYWWPRAATLAFYADMAESAADTVVLGEVVCARRHEMKLPDWVALGRELAQAGKTVVLATQPLVAGEAELRLLRRVCEQHEFMVEAGDASALGVLARRAPEPTARPFVIGPHVNVYHAAALTELAGLGATRWVPPLELALDAIARINPPDARVHGPQGALATEVFAFGRMPLAFSARCFTARHHRLKKDECDFRCRDDADGLPLLTEEGQPFLVLNGIQTQSAAVQCLLDAHESLRQAGVTRLRLSPCSHGFAQVVARFDEVFNQAAPVGEALAALDALPLPGPRANGFAHRRAGLECV